MGHWERDTRVEALPGGEGQYRAQLAEDWAVWGPNGGYRAAIALRAMGAASKLQRPASFSCNFVATGRFGPVDLEVTPLVARKRVEAWRCRMHQEGETILEASGWVVGEGLRGYDHVDVTKPDVPTPQDLRGYQDLADNYGDWYPFWRSIEGRPVRWDEERGPAIWQTWMRLLDTPPLDDPFLDAARSVLWMDTSPWNALIAAHSWPHEYLGPNLDLHLQFHHSAKDAEWVLCDGHSPFAGDGLGGTTGRLWTPDGRLVASGLSHLLCRPNPGYAQAVEEARKQGRL